MRHPLRNKNKVSVIKKLCWKIFISLIFYIKPSLKEIQKKISL